MILVLRPAAPLLPYARTLALARCFGTIIGSMPWYGRRKAEQMRAAFPEKSRRDAENLAARQLARALCDGVVLRRVCGKKDFARWRLEERLAEGVDQVRSSGESFILATGHFSRQAFIALGDTRFLPHRLFAVSLPRTVRTLHPRTW